MKCYNFNPEKLCIRATVDTSIKEVDTILSSIYLNNSCLWYIKSDVGSHYLASQLTSVTVDPVAGVTAGVTFTGEGCLLMLVGWLEGAKTLLEGLVDYSDTGHKKEWCYNTEYFIHKELSESFMYKLDARLDWGYISVDPAKLASIHCNCNGDPDVIENYVGDFSAT